MNNGEATQDALDKIIIKGLRVFGHHGASEEEQERGQDFLIDVECSVDLSRPCLSDDLGDTVDYDWLIREIEPIVANERYKLLEALAGRIALVALQNPMVRSTTVTVAKPKSPVKAKVDLVQVQIHRSAEQ